MYQMIQAVTQLDSPSWRSLFQPFEFGSWNFTLPQKGHGQAELAGLFGLFLLQTFYQSLSSVLAKGFFSSNGFHHTRFFQESTLQGAGKTIVARHLAIFSVQQQVLPVEHLLAYRKMVGWHPLGWHPEKNPTPYSIYTCSTGHW